MHSEPIRRKIYCHSTEEFKGTYLSFLKKNGLDSLFLLLPMTKQEYIKYWILTAEKDWNVVNSLFKDGNYLHCLFFAHLTLEKLLKANWIKDNQENIPLKTHSLVRLAQGTKLSFNEEEMVFLERMNDFQLEGRYPDYQFKIYQRCTKKFTKPVLEKVEEIRIFLIETLQ
jgi:HEPN domain-containing protein